jgi:hypothetical protein
MTRLIKILLFVTVSLLLEVQAQEVISLSCTGETEKVVDFVEKRAPEKSKITIDLDVKNSKIKIEGLLCFTQSSEPFRLYGQTNKEEEDRLACRGWIDALYDENNISFYLKTKIGQSSFPAEVHFNLNRVFGEAKIKQTVMCATKSCQWMQFEHSTTMSCKKLVRQF